LVGGCDGGPFGALAHTPCLPGAMGRGERREKRGEQGRGEKRKRQESTDGLGLELFVEVQEEGQQDGQDPKLTGVTPGLNIFYADQCDTRTYELRSRA